MFEKVLIVVFLTKLWCCEVVGIVLILSRTRCFYSLIEQAFSVLWLLCIFSYLNSFCKWYRFVFVLFIFFDCFLLSLFWFALMSFCQFLFSLISARESSLVVSWQHGFFYFNRRDGNSLKLFEIFWILVLSQIKIIKFSIELLFLFRNCLHWWVLLSRPSIRIKN